MTALFPCRQLKSKLKWFPRDREFEWYQKNWKIWKEKCTSSAGSRDCQSLLTFKAGIFFAINGSNVPMKDKIMMTKIEMMWRSKLYSSVSNDRHGSSSSIKASEIVFVIVSVILLIVYVLNACWFRSFWRGGRKFWIFETR